MSTIWTSINQRTLSQIDATGKVYFIRDNDLKGFGIKVTARGKATFIIEGRIRGSRTTRVSIGDVELVSLREARTEAHLKLGRMKKGEDLNFTTAIDNSSHDSLFKHTQAYIDAKSTLSRGTIDGYQNVLNKFFKDWMNMPVEAISPSMIGKRRADLLRQGLSENYVNRGFRTLKLILNTAELPHQNPVSKYYKKYKLSLQSTNKSSFLRARDIAYLIHAYGEEMKERKEGTTNEKCPYIWATCFFMLLTGLRKTEVLNLLWSDVTTETITIRETKNDREHVIPNVGMVKDLLNSLGKLSETKTAYLMPANSRVFGMTYSKYRTAFEPVQQELSFTAHDLRRTFAEHANLCGFDDNMIGMALNHKTVSFQRRTYMSGQLAKMHLMKQMYLVYQTQLAFYVFELSEERAPNDFSPYDEDNQMITDFEFREFMHISSPETTKDFLQSLRPNTV